jgi:light-regulated signal transduction histidine kinase (bacteriophytochrome)
MALALKHSMPDKVFAIFQRLHGREKYAGTGSSLRFVKGLFKIIMVISVSLQS